MSNTKQLSAGKLHYSFGQLNMSDDWSTVERLSFHLNFLGNLNSTNHRSLTAGQRHTLFLGKLRSHQRKIAFKIQPFYWSTQQDPNLTDEPTPDFAAPTNKRWKKGTRGASAASP